MESRSILGADVALPLPRWRGLLAGPVAVGVLVTVVSVLFEHPVPGQVLGAGTCLAAAIVCLMFSFAPADNRLPAPADVVIFYVVAALVILGIGLVVASLPNAGSVFLAAMLVPVATISAVANRWGRWAVASWAIAVGVSAVATAGSPRNWTAAQTLVLAVTIVGIAWSVGWVAETIRGQMAFREAIAGLTETLDAAVIEALELTEGATDFVVTRSLPRVADVLPASRVSVFSRQGAFGPIVPRAIWPSALAPTDGLPVGQLNERSSQASGPGDAAEPILVDALKSGKIVATGAAIALPVGWSDDGDLVMLIQLVPGPSNRFRHRSEAAETVASIIYGAVARVSRSAGAGVGNQTDQLTGLSTRQVLFERVQIEMDRSLRSDEPLSIALVDLDHFSDYNTAHGRAAGDAVLRSIAAVIISNLRRTDVVVRFGGEQFCLLFPATGIEGGHHILDQLRTGGRDTWSRFGVTMSVGLTAWDRMEDAHSIIGRADEALLRAKETGRDRVVSIELATGT